MPAYLGLHLGPAAHSNFITRYDIIGGISIPTRPYIGIYLSEYPVFVFLRFTKHYTAYVLKSQSSLEPTIPAYHISPRVTVREVVDHYLERICWEMFTFHSSDIGYLV